MLKREFELDDDYIDDLKTEIIDAKRLAADEDGKVLVWTGAAPVPSSKPVLSLVEGFQVPSAPQHLAPKPRRRGISSKSLRLLKSNRPNHWNCVR